jgi:hypothetical protein
LHRHEIEDHLRERRYVLNEWHRSKPVEQHFVWDHRRKYLVRVPVMDLENGDWWIPTILPVDKKIGQYSCWRLAEAERAWLGDKFYRKPYSYNSQLAIVNVGFANPHPAHAGQRNYCHLDPFFSWSIRDKRMLRAGDLGVIELLRDRTFCRAVKESILKWGPKMPPLLNGLEPDIYLIKPGAHRYIPQEFFLSTP